MANAWLTPELPITEDRVYACIALPDDPTMRQAFSGAFFQLTQVYNWEGTEAEREATASVWLDLYLLAMNQYDNANESGCTEMLDCTAIETCIENSDAIAAAIERAAYSYGVAAGGTVSGGMPGQPMTPEQANANVAAGTNISCNKDILWAQCLAIVQYINRLQVDVLEQIEVATNGAELVDSLISTFPGIAAAWDAIGGEGFLELINYFQDAITETYVAQYTESYEQELACDIFCACESDCAITANRLYDVIAARMGAYIGTPIESLLEVLDTVAGLSYSGTLVVNASYFIAFGSLKFANLLIPGIADRGMNMLLWLAVNDANDDWELICDECPPDTWSHVWDFKTNASALGWTLDSGTSTSAGIVAGGDGTVKIHRSIIAGGVITDAEIRVKRPSPQNSQFAVCHLYEGVSGDYITIIRDTNAATESETFTFTGTLGVTKATLSAFLNNYTTGGSIIEYISLAGTGTDIM